MNKVKGSFILGAFSLLFSASALAEEWKHYEFIFPSNQGGVARITDKDTINLEKGDKVEFINMLATSFNSVHIRGKITLGENISVTQNYYCNALDLNNYNQSGRLYFPNKFETLYGPCKIEISAHGAPSTGISLNAKITRANETQSKNVTGYSLVLPESKDNSYNLVLESSTDLVNWTSDKTGSKGPSEKKRFYRLRAVKE